MQFTLVSTVLNEARGIKETISDMEKQSVKPSEIIITDAGSTDGTYELLLDWKGRSDIPIRVLSEPGCNVARGRNLAIKDAQYDLIVSTDFGCRFHPDWLRSITAPFEGRDAMVAGGAFAVNEEAQVSLSAKAAFIMAGGYVPKVFSEDFIPSSRSIAYRKEVFDEVGGYCEWLTLAADDFVFGKEIKAHHFNIVGVGEPYVYWGRHKKTIGFVKEAIRYGRGDGEARVNGKYFVVTLLTLFMRDLFVIGVILLGVLALFNVHGGGLMVLGCLLLFFGFGFRPYLGYFLRWNKFRSRKYDWKVLLFGFFLIERVALGYIRGYLNGFFYSSDFQKEQAAMLRKRLMGSNSN